MKKWVFIGIVWGVICYLDSFVEVGEKDPHIIVNKSVIQDKDVLDVQQHLETLTNELRKNACVLPRTIQWNYHVIQIRNQRSLEKDYQTIRLKNIGYLSKVIEITANAQFSDIGTSNPICPIPGAEIVMTSEAMKERFDVEYAFLYFTLNPDGSVNVDSITTTYPREQSGTEDSFTLHLTEDAPSALHSDSEPQVNADDIEEAVLDE
jgi:hypothetical protein